MMSERIGGGPDTRILSNAVAEECTFLPSTESLLGRLNQIDIRLRQLEKQKQQQHQQRRFPQLPENNYFIEDLQARHLECRSFSAALHEVHLKGTLMQRLHLLECRIHQLSHELDKGSSTAVSSSAAAKQLLTSDQSMWLQQIEREMKLQQDNVVPSSTRKIGAGELQAQPSKLKNIINDTRREAMTAVEKRANNIRRKEKRRLAHTQLYKKWFPVGC